MDDESRLNQIMQMDTRALLSTIKDLESKLSQYQRQDSVPPWASALFPRLEKLEAGLRLLNIHMDGEGSTATHTEDGVSRETLAREDRLMARIKSELQSHAESNQLGMDAKVAAMNAEIQRVHQLLQIRPTTSEYQKVMFIVNDQETRMKHDVTDIQNRLLDVVHTSIAKEIGSVISSIKKNEGVNDRTVDGLFRKLEAMSTEHYDLKVSSHNDYEQLTAEIRVNAANIEQLKTQAACHEAKVKNEFSYVMELLTGQDRSLAAMGEKQDAVTAAIYDAMRKQELSVKADHSEVIQNVRRMGDKLEFQIRDVKTFVESVQQQVDEQRTASMMSVGQLSSSIAELQESIDANKTKQNQVLRILEKIQELDPTEKIAEINKKLVLHQTELAATGETIEGLRKTIAEHHAFSVAVKDDARVEKDVVHGKLEELYGAMEEAQKAIEVGSNDASLLADSIVDLKAGISRLSQLSGELEYVKQINSGNIETLNTIQERLEGLDAMLKYVAETSSAASKTNQAQLETLTNQLQESLLETQAEIEARVEAMQEQMESVGSELATRAGPKGGAGGPLRRKKSTVSALESEDMDSDEESRVGHRRESNSSNRSKNSSGHGGKSLKKKKSNVVYPVEGQPANPEPVAKAHTPKRISLAHNRRASSRGILLGSSASSREKRLETIPAGLMDSGEFAETPPSSQEQQRPSNQQLAESKEDMGSGQPPKPSDASTPKGKKIPTSFHPAASQSSSSSPLVTSPKTSSVVIPTAPPASSFFGESGDFQVINAPASNGPSNNAPGGGNSKSVYEHQAEPAHEPQTGTSAGSMESSEVRAAPESHETTSAVISVGRLNRKEAASQEVVSVGAKESVGSSASSVSTKKVKTGAISAGSVSVSTHRDKVSGYIGGASGSAGYSNAYRYQPNQSSMTLGTNSMLQNKNMTDGDDGPFEEQAINDLLAYAEQVAELGHHFEEIAVRRSLVPDISEESCSELAAISLSVADIVAKLVDTEALLRILRSRPDQPIYGDSFISNRRLKLIDEVLSETRKQLEGAGPEPGITRLDARDYFMKKVEKAFQVSLSKHDQVLLPTQSRAGKVKIPSCIACDRPLLDKVRSDMVTRSEITTRGHIVPFGSMMSHTEPMIGKGAGSQDEGSFYGELEQGSLMSLSLDAGNTPASGPKSFPSTLPRQPSRGGVLSLQKQNPRDIGALGSAPGSAGGAYTLLSGFKMPNSSKKSNIKVVTKFKDDKYFFGGPDSDMASRHSGEIDLGGSGAGGFLGSPKSKRSPY